MGIELHYILFKSQGYLSTLENMIAPFVFWLNYQISEILKLGLLDPISWKKEKEYFNKICLMWMVTMVCTILDFLMLILPMQFIVLQSIHVGRESSSMTLLREQVVCLSQELKAKAKL